MPPPWNAAISCCGDTLPDPSLHLQSPGLREAIPHSDRLVGLPQGPFVGEIDYDDIQSILANQARWMTTPERRVVADLAEYLEFKRSNLPNKTSLKSPRPTGPAGEIIPGASENLLKIVSLQPNSVDLAIRRP